MLRLADWSPSGRQGKGNLVPYQLQSYMKFYKSNQNNPPNGKIPKELTWPNDREQSNGAACTLPELVVVRNHPQTRIKEVPDVG